MYAAGVSEPEFLDRHGLWSSMQKYRFERIGRLSGMQDQERIWKRQGPCLGLEPDPVPLLFCRRQKPLPYGVDAARGPLAHDLDDPTSRARAAGQLHREAERLLQEIPVVSRVDADGRWKDALDVYFQHCVSLLWPALHALIDWSQSPVFLDKELKSLMAGRRRNRRYVDKLLAVRLSSGEGVSLLLHLEVQARLQAGFSERMFEYFVRLREKYPEQPVVQLAVITRGRPVMERLRYQYVPLGENFLSLDFSLPMLHLQNWRGREAELAAQAQRNPFAWFMQVELEATRQATPVDRLQRKVSLLRQLYAHGYDPADFHRLFAFLDSAMVLPPVLDLQFVQAFQQIETQGVSSMAYLTSVERVAIGRGRLEGRVAGKAEGKIEGKVEGRVEGLREAVRCLLEQRFGSLPENVLEQLGAMDQAGLQDCLTRVISTRSLEELLPRH